MDKHTDDIKRLDDTGEDDPEYVKVLFHVGQVDFASPKLGSLHLVQCEKDAKAVIHVPAALAAAYVFYAIVERLMALAGSSV